MVIRLTIFLNSIRLLRRGHFYKVNQMCRLHVSNHFLLHLTILFCFSMEELTFNLNKFTVTLLFSETVLGIQLKSTTFFRHVSK